MFPSGRGRARGSTEAGGIVRSSRVVAVLAALGVALGVLTTSAAAAQALQINVLSTRADLVSGGQALTSIALPAGTNPAGVTVTLNGTNVTSQFAERPNGQFEGLLTGLVNGSNTVTASVANAAS